MKNYNVTLTDENGSFLTDIIVEAPDAFMALVSATTTWNRNFEFFSEADKKIVADLLSQVGRATVEEASDSN